MTKPNEAIEGLMQMNMIAEAVVGYRQKLVDGGVPPNVADTMSVEYHTTLLEVVRVQMQGKAGIRR